MPDRRSSRRSATRATRAATRSSSPCSPSGWATEPRVERHNLALRRASQVRCHHYISMRPASVVESVEADFCFDVEDLEISGYFELTDDEAYAVETALYTGLGEPCQSAQIGRASCKESVLSQQAAE